MNESHNASTVQLIEDFRDFVLNRVNANSTSPSIDELYDEWRLQNPSAAETKTDLQAIAASLRDLDQGEKGRKATDFIQDFKKRNGLD